MLLNISLLTTLVLFIGIASSAPIEDIDHVALGGPQVCTKNKEGWGDTDYKATKDCCAHVHQDKGVHNVFFNEAIQMCIGTSGRWSNAVNTGGMVTCCTQRRKGSRGEDAGENFNNSISAGLDILAMGRGEKGPRRRPGRGRD